MTPADLAKLPVVQVTAPFGNGWDGYTAVLALAELSPDFEGKPVILAERLDGVPLGPDHLRVVVPGDGTIGRSVRDIAVIGVTKLRRAGR